MRNNKKFYEISIVIITSILIAISLITILIYIDDGNYKKYDSFYRYLSTDAFTKTFSQFFSYIIITGTSVFSIVLFYLLKRITFLKKKVLLTFIANFMITVLCFPVLYFLIVFIFALIYKVL